MELADTSQGEGGGAQGMSWVLEPPVVWGSLWSETGPLTSEEGGDTTVVVKEPGWVPLGAERDKRDHWI